jgi:hypothetical protein
MALRFVLAAVAVLALAWLGVLLRDHEIGEGAVSVLESKRKLSKAEVDRQVERLEDAELLSPDSSWQFERGYNLIGPDPKRSVRELEALVDAEPENLPAWAALLTARRVAYGRASPDALAQIRRLDPIEQQGR